MSPELRRYLDLEQAMEILDTHGNPEADHVRDIMDLAWRDLSPADRVWINARTLPPLGAELHLSIGQELFVEPPRRNPDPESTWKFDDWRPSAA